MMIHKNQYLENVWYGSHVKGWLFERCKLLIVFQSWQYWPYMWKEMLSVVYQTHKNMKWMAVNA